MKQYRNKETGEIALQSTRGEYNIDTGETAWEGYIEDNDEWEYIDDITLDVGGGDLLSLGDDMWVVSPEENYRIYKGAAFVTFIGKRWDGLRFGSLETATSFAAIHKPCFSLMDLLPYIDSDKHYAELFEKAKEGVNDVFL